MAISALVVLLISSALASRTINRRFGFNLDCDPLPTIIAWGTVFVAWPLAMAMAIGFVALVTNSSLFQLPMVAGVSATGAFALHLWRSRSLPPLCERHEGVWLNGLTPGLLFFAVPVLALHVFLFVDALLRPPLSFDGLFYHLPLIVHWLNTGQLSMLPDIFQACGPANGELWQALFVATRIECLIELAMFPIGLFLAAVVAGLARELGARRRGALICSLMVLASPMVALQMYGSYVDMFGTAFLLGSFYWVLRCLRRRTQFQVEASLAGLSLGVALGTKGSLLPWVLPVALAFAIAAYFAFRSEAGDKFRKLGSVLWPFVVCMPICSAFWYVRNTWETGWPLYPLKLHLFGRDVGAGILKSEICNDLVKLNPGWISLGYPWGEWKNAGYSYSLDNGLGPMFAVFVAAGLVYLIFRAFRGLRRERRLRNVLVFGFVVIGAVLFVKVCFSYPRYALPLWVILFAAMGPAISLLEWRHPRGSKLLLGTTIALSVAMVGLWPFKSLVGRVLDGQMGRAATYGVPELFDHLPSGTVVLNMASTANNYPLLGIDWTNEVIDANHAIREGLTRPLTQEKLDSHQVEIVFARDSDRPEQLFAPGIVYEEIGPKTYRIAKQQGRMLIGAKREEL